MWHLFINNNKKEKENNKKLFLSKGLLEYIPGTLSRHENYHKFFEYQLAQSVVSRKTTAI